MAQGMDSSILLPISTPSSCHRVLFTPAIVCGIFYGLDRASNYRNSLVCKDWAAWAALYVWESVSPSVFRVLRPVIVQKQMRMTSPRIPRLSTTDETWLRFLDCCRRTRELHLTPYGGPPRQGQRFFDSMPSESTVVFTNMKIARMHFDLLRSPFIAPSLVDLTILLAPLTCLGIVKFLSISDVNGAAFMLRNVETLRVEGDSQSGMARRELMEFIRHLTNLKTLILDPPALTVAMFRLSASLPHLERIAVNECSHSGSGKATFHNEHAALWSPVGSYGPACYTALRRFAFQTTRTVHVGRIILQDPFPYRTLLTLWIKFVDSHETPRSDVKRLIADLSSSCKALEGLTLRFCGRTDGARSFDEEGTSSLCWEDISSFLSFPCLSQFAIDDTVPLHLMMDDIMDLSRRAGRFRSLWLNPYPLCGGGSDLAGSGLGLDALMSLSKNCRSLESLGILLAVDSDFLCEYGGEQDFEEVQQFACLAEFSVGWSYIPKFTHSASPQATAQLLSRVFGRDTKLLTNSDYNWEGASDWVDSVMRATPDVLGYNVSRSLDLSLEWKALWAFAVFLRASRETRGFVYSGPRVLH